MQKIIPFSWTFSMVLGATLFLCGCQTQKTATPTSAVMPSFMASSAPPNAAPPPAAESAPAVVVTIPAGTTFRMKAGVDAPFTDAEGRVWLPDQGFDGGDMAEREPDTKIGGTTDPKLYVTEHYAMNSFSCKIPNGNYTVNLYFAETFDGITGPGQRVFSFNVQGEEFKDVDLWVKAGGPDRAYVVTVPVKVVNGTLRIDFTTQVENPEINALEIIPNP